MSKKTIQPLHIEWTPGWVRAVDVLTGESETAASIGELPTLAARNKTAIVGIGRGSIFLKALRLPKAGKEDLRRILGIQVGQIFPLAADKLVFEFIQTADHNSEGYLTIVAAMRSDELKTLLADLRQTGIKATRILPVALSAPAVAASAGATDALVMENGARGLSVDVVQGGALRFSRVAPPGSEASAEAQRTLAAIRAENLPIVAVGDIPIPGALPSLGNPLSVLHEAPAFNFELPEDRGRDASERKRKRTVRAAACFAAALLFAIIVWQDYQIQMSNANQAKAAWTRQLKKMKTNLNDVTNDEQNVAMVQQELNTAFSPAQPLSDVASVVSDSLPQGAWLTQIQVERGKPLQIRGVAKGQGDVSAFVTALGSNPRFRNVTLIFANTGAVGATPVVDFDVTATCVGNLPLPAPIIGTKTASSTAGTAGGNS